MIRFRLMTLLSLLALLPCLSPAMAQGLVLSLSKPRVTITSTFTGEDIVLFGVIEPAAPDIAPATDVIVTVRGPSENFVTWRKERRWGLWVNTDERSFQAVPSYLAVLSNRQPERMAGPDLLRQEQAGLVNNRFLQKVGRHYADTPPTDPFRQAFLRVKQSQGLYLERDTGVEFIAPHIFRASIPIPGTAPTGTYEVMVKTFVDGALSHRGTVTLEVAKVDFEHTVAHAAQNHPWLYGLATAFGALLIGFIANLAFRRD